MPVDNKKDLDEIPENVRGKIKFVIAEDMETVLKTALAQGEIKFKTVNAHKEEKIIISKDG